MILRTYDLQRLQINSSILTCSSIDLYSVQYAYTHKHCLRMTSKCKICGQAYVTTTAPTPIISRKSQCSALLGT